MLSLTICFLREGTVQEKTDIKKVRLRTGLITLRLDEKLLPDKSLNRSFSILSIGNHYLVNARGKAGYIDVAQFVAGRINHGMLFTAHVVNPYHGRRIFLQLKGYVLRG